MRKRLTQLTAFASASAFLILIDPNQATANVLLTWNLDVSRDLEKKSIFHEKKSLFQDSGSRRISSRWFEWTPLSETDFFKVDPPLPRGGFQGHPQGASWWKPVLIFDFGKAQVIKVRFRKCTRPILIVNVCFHLLKSGHGTNLLYCTSCWQLEKRLSPAKRQNYVNT